MAIVNVYLTSTGGSIDSAGNKTFTKTFVVQCDSRTDSINDVDVAIIAEHGGNYYVDTYDEGPNVDCVCSGKQLNQRPTTSEDGGFWWDCSHTYTNQSIPDVAQRYEPGSFGTGGAGASLPTSPPSPSGGGGGEFTVIYPKFSVTKKEIEVVGTVDLDGNAFETSAGQPFPSGFVTTRAHLVYDITWTDLEYDMADTVLYQDKINDDDLGVFDAFSLKCNLWVAATDFIQGVMVYNHHVQLEWAPELWHPYKVLDAGTHVKGNPDNGEDPDLLYPIREESDGSFATIPHKLNGVGYELVTGGQETLNYKAYDATDFTGIVP